jgi:hypothetical protein
MQHTVRQVVWESQVTWKPSYLGHFSFSSTSLYHAYLASDSVFTCQHCLYQVCLFLYPTIWESVLRLISRYWGKRDTNLNLPVNSSLSLSLDQDQFCTTTTGQANAMFDKDRLWLNGKEQNIHPGGRLDKCIRAMRALRKKYEDECDQPDKVRSLSYCVFN